MIARYSLANLCIDKLSYHFRCKGNTYLDKTKIIKKIFLVGYKFNALG